MNIQPLPPASKQIKKQQWKELTVEEADNCAKQEEIEHPYFDKMEEEHSTSVKKKDKEFVEFIMGQKYNSRIFSAKIVETLQEIRDIDVKLDEYNEKLVNATSDMKSWWEWLIEKRKDAKKEEEKALRRWQCYRDRCLGKLQKNDEDYQVKLERAKEIEVAEIMPYKADSKCGKRRYYKCPLHHEDTASFVEYVDQCSFHCFGCGVGGDVIDLYMKLNNVKFVEAINSLSKY